MTDEEQIIERAVHWLVAQLGESPEAVRGALTVTRMMAAGTKAVIDVRVDDADDALTTQLALLNRIKEVLGD